MNGSGYPVDIGSETDNSNFNIAAAAGAPYLKCNAPLIQNGSLAKDPLRCTVGDGKGNVHSRTCVVRAPTDGRGYVQEGDIISLSNVTVLCPRADAFSNSDQTPP